MKIAAVALVAILGLGCDASQSAPAPEEERGAGGAAGAPAGSTGTPAKTGDLYAPPRDEQRARIGDAPPPQPASTEEPAATGEEGATEEPRAPERDLAAELRTLAGDPSSCLSAVADLPDAVSITLEATVTTSGVVTRSYARGPGIPDDAIECVRRRLDGARMRAPIENAPRTVTTTLELRRQTPAKNEPEATR